MSTRVIRRGPLSLDTTPKADDGPPASPIIDPRQHPSGVWDMPAAAGYRRLVGVDHSGNLAIELNVSDRIPAQIRQRLHAELEAAMEQSLIALKV